MGVPCEMVVPFSSLAQRVPAPIPAHCHAGARDFARGVGDGSPTLAGFCSQTMATTFSWGTLFRRIDPEDVVTPVLWASVQ